MEACENCLCDSSEPKENVFAVDVANEVEDFLAKVLSDHLWNAQLGTKRAVRALGSLQVTGRGLHTA